MEGTALPSARAVKVAALPPRPLRRGAPAALRAKSSAIEDAPRHLGATGADRGAPERRTTAMSMYRNKNLPGEAG
eukprot:CAMPEP_0171259724 /NCGR_PEP_ID=MMETSP0790-20130122/55078_1 /TAXON_ID=2925 /ORGANISM="Alexandrium catenella, Strain OF101" /LENGTH=74 /DNA_ID=CAMNT_0011728013 /DNA_START=55 /DNA_END=276 /DNA_ORIENTATION=+